ncbi:MAG: bifunctional methylenetetrahydrofolate dehydrogenase/methenyltetrahydrofolate cyclohydrolase FolD [Pseudomonadota bacterium]
MSQGKTIDGKAISAELLQAISRVAEDFTSQTGAKPNLTVVMVGDNPASSVYVRNKARTAERVGFASSLIKLDSNTSEQALLDQISQLNADDTVDGILVQLPLPEQISEPRIIEAIDPTKDVDGFHPLNVGRLGAGMLDGTLVPCTPAGCIILAKCVHGGDLSGLDAIVVGRSNIVGKPAAQLLLSENCTVTIAHSRTRDLKARVKAADLVIAAVGRPEFIQGDWIKPGATVIDVGINRVAAPEKGPDATKLVGDVSFGDASEVASAITPVPGGVGPMTIALLMINTLMAAQLRRRLDAITHNDVLANGVLEKLASHVVVRNRTN